MPEPVVLIIGGIALYKYLTGGPTPPTAEQAEDAAALAPAASTADNQPLATVPSGALATNTSIANQGAAPLAIAGEAIPVPSGLIAKLDNDTAMTLRAYAALNPADFQAFLDRYADHIVLRNDYYFEMLTDPPVAGFEPTPGMLVGMGTAAYKVVQALNGVAAGKPVDLFGLGATVAGQLPGINPDLLSGLQAAAMGYRAITSLTQVLSIASTNGVSVLNFSGMVAAGAYPGLAALPLTGVLMAVGLVVDIGFTIIGDKPDMQKAIDVALDVASLAVLFIPVIGVVIAIVIQLVKFIIDLFGEDLFGGGMTHEQREVLEAARYGQQLNDMFPSLAAAYTPRELFWTILAWGSGYCGGQREVAISVSIVLHAGDTFMVGGTLFTVPPTMDGYTHGFGNNEQPGGCYWIKSGPLAAITNDEQAWLLGAYAPVNGIVAVAQLGVIDWRKEQFNDPTQKLIMARTTPMREFLVKHRLSLDQIDQIAMEYRAQPHLLALAQSFGWASWQELFGNVVAEEWTRFTWTHADGALSQFAQENGYPTVYRFREAAFGSFEFYFARAELAASRLYQNALDAQRALLEYNMRIASGLTA